MVDVVSREELGGVERNIGQLRELIIKKLTKMQTETNEDIGKLRERVDALEKQGTNQDPEPWWEGGSGTLPVPRIITAEECREGMVIAGYYDDASGVLGKFSHLDNDGDAVVDVIEDEEWTLSRTLGVVIVLLSEPTA